MIRRDITLDDGTPAWLLISQVEHARLSGELTQAWQESFPPELVAGITHHDDGWARWELAPQLDQRRGRPLSFTEMPVADALTIWDASIAAARRFGPLSGAIVAGHFLGLAGGSDHALQSPMRDWQVEHRKMNHDWLGEWKSAARTNTQAVADRAQQMLLTADLLSLWLCCDGPIPSDDSAVVPNAEIESRQELLLDKYRFSTNERSLSPGKIAWFGSLSPWPFLGEILQLQTPAVAAAATRYSSWAAVSAAGTPLRLLWELRKTLSDSGEC